MGTHHQPHHVIDFLFPLALLFVFAFSAVSVILLAADIYQDTVSQSSRSFPSETALSYLTEKLRQSDQNASVSLGSFDGCDALILRQNYEHTTYTTYIYAFDGTLRELFLTDSAEASASDGMSILEVTNLSMEETGPGLFAFSCTDADGTLRTALVQLRSMPDSQEKGDAS